MLHLKTFLPRNPEISGSQQQDRQAENIKPPTNAVADAEAQQYIREAHEIQTVHVVSNFCSWLMISSNQAFGMSTVC